MSLYKLYGLTVHSEIKLNAPVCESEIPADINVRWEDNYPVHSDQQKGHVLAEYSVAEGYGYTVSLSEHGYILRFRNACSFTISKDLGTVVVHRDMSVNEEVVPVFICGNVIAVVLALRGIHTLHASAVGYNGRGLAFMGPIGTGKSTMAALFCSRGASLIADDLLRLGIKNNGLSCFTGPPYLRLRKDISSITEGFGAHGVSKSVDGRSLLTWESASDISAYLDSIIIPRPSRDSDDMSVKRLAGAEAVLALMGNTKITGWKDREIQRKQFHQMSLLAKRVPLFEVHIPWGLPLPGELVDELADKVVTRHRVEVA